MKEVLFGIITVCTMNSFCQPNFDWAISAGGVNYVNCKAVASDVSGNVYSVGTFNGTVDFDPGASTFDITAAGGYDFFLLKLNSDGEFQWAINIGGVENENGNIDITLDGGGNLLLIGEYDGTIDFDPGAGTFNMTATSAGTDVFVLKLDADANFIWAKNLEGISNDYGFAVRTDVSENIFITGNFANSLDADPGAGTFILDHFAGAAYVIKLTSAGDFVWGKNFGGTTIYAREMAIDGSGNVIVTGNFTNTGDFDPGSGTATLSPYTGGISDSYVLKLDNDGVFQWVRQFTGASTIATYGLAVDSEESVYASGYFNGTADFDPGTSTYNLTASPQSGFVTKLSASGSFVWAHTIGDFAYSVATDSDNNLYTTGNFGATFDFDPGAGVFDMTSSSTDAFVQILTSDEAFVWAGQMGGTTSTIGYGIDIGADNAIHVGGYFLGTTDFDPGAGTYEISVAGSSINGFVCKLSQCSISLNTISESACYSYTVPSGDETYTTLGTYSVMDTLTNTCGADSILIINLIIHGPTSNSITETTCDTYAVPSGDETYSVSGTYTDTIPNTMGCDSVLTINLTVTTVDAGVSSSGTTLTADATGATYQWVDCDAGYAAISGETSQNFTPTANGNYAVIVTQDGCSDTSACESVTQVGLGENDPSSMISVYPNPTDGPVIIEMGAYEEWVNVVIYDPSGKVISRNKFENGKLLKIGLGEETGVYIIEIITALHSEHFQVIKG